MDKIILMVHPMTGLIGLLAALWVFVEAMNANPRNGMRLWWGGMITALAMVATWIAGGYWYVTYYAADKAMILDGPWPLAHSLIMETKEHLFFITLILSLLRPIVITHEDLSSNRSARILVMTIAGFIVLSAIALDGMGALIGMAARLSIEI